MMNASVDTTIAKLRAAVSVGTDAELAHMLGIDQSTISTWRSRGRVPARFVKLLNDGGKGAAPQRPQVWGELQDRAQAMALLRFTLLREAVAKSREVDRAMPVFLDLKPFWLVLHRAVHELRLKMETLRVDLATAQALLMQEDLRDPEAAAQRVGAQLAEDLADNPWLKDWR